MVRRIKVTGQGKVSVPPDQVEIGIRISYLRPEPAFAQQLVGKTTRMVLEKLQEMGVDSKEIETTNYRINATHDWVNDTRVFKGYTATNILEGKTGKLELVGKILQAAVTGGAL